MLDRWDEALFVYQNLLDTGKNLNKDLSHLLSYLHYVRKIGTVEFSPRYMEDLELSIKEWGEQSHESMTSLYNLATFLENSNNTSAHANYSKYKIQRICTRC